MSLCYFEEEFRPVGDCRLPISDLIVQRGVGVFDSVRSYSRRAFAMQPHLDRLRSSAISAGMSCDTIISLLPRIIREGFARTQTPDDRDLLARPFITGGDVNINGKFPHPRFFVIFEEGPQSDPATYEKGLALHPTSVERPFPLVKSTNYLFGYMPSSGVENVFECLYCPNGEITETVRGSFFLCVDKKIITAPVGRVLSGVTRNIVVDIARKAGYTVEERCPKMSELVHAQEALLTSSWNEVAPVVRVGETIIGTGTPGPIAANLLKLFREELPCHLDT